MSRGHGPRCLEALEGERCSSICSWCLGVHSGNINVLSQTLAEQLTRQVQINRRGLCWIIHTSNWPSENKISQSLTIHILVTNQLIN